MRSGRFALLAATLVLASAGVAQARPGHAAAYGDWYWSPGLCKSYLKQFGMELSDGRTFNIQSAVCLGWGGTDTCEWTGRHHEKRLYTTFSVIARSFDGTVRTFRLRVTNKKAYRADQIKAVAHEANATRFDSITAAWIARYAPGEQARGCAESSG